MTRPGPILASVLLHAGVAGLFLVGWAGRPPEDRPILNAVPVSIVSDVEIAAAPADNPQPEPVEEDAATAPPPEMEATPTPPEPQPTPPPRPQPRPSPTPAPPPKKTTPTPPREQPARPAPRREQPSLDLDALAGPPRASQNQGQRAPTGQQGQGRASQATGPQVTAIFNQVYNNWILPCDIPGADQFRITVEVTLSETGRITAGPTLIGARSDPVYRAAADGALRALRQTAPFDVPEGFPGGAYRPVFNTERACRNR